MAKYDITYACGHTGEVQLFGKLKDRDHKIEWLETQDCPECKKAKTKAAVKANMTELCLSPLVGSEKQIEWANQLRVRTYNCIEQLLEVFIENPDWLECKDVSKALTIVRGWRTQLDTKTDAKWWIDNRYDLPEFTHLITPVRYPIEEASNRQIIGRTISKLSAILTKTN